jgi:hypothetical protein
LVFQLERTEAVMNKSLFAILTLFFAAALCSPSATVLVDGTTSGYYNDSIGTSLDGTQPQFPLAFPAGGDPLINPSPEPNLTAAAGVLGGWLAPE